MSQTHNERESAQGEITDWPVYWKERGMPWRSEPPPGQQRRRKLTACLAIEPDLLEGIYPFKNIRLDRADLEWLLEKHSIGIGPVANGGDKSDEEEQPGLDLRGADLRDADLRYLPLVGARAGLTQADQMDLLQLIGDFAVEQEQIVRDEAAAHLERTDLSGAQLQRASFTGTNLTGVYLEGANLEQALLSMAQLERTHFQEAHLEGADLSFAYLENAHFRLAHLEGAFLREVHADRAVFSQAHLEGADLTGAELREASLDEARLEGANLMGARLEGASFRKAYLAGRQCTDEESPYVLANSFFDLYAGSPALLPADLKNTTLDMHTNFTEALIGDGAYGFVSVADARWNQVNLAVVDWTLLAAKWGVLGDEWVARNSKQLVDMRSVKFRLSDYQDAIRSNQQLALSMREQGLNEQSVQLTYRAQRLRQRVLYSQHRWPDYLLSCLLWAIAGYGYRPVRSFVAYVVTILGFMGLYLLNSHYVTPHLRWDEALVLSMSSFHGRGFFSQTITLGDTYARLSAFEAFIGLIIEATFIATLTQRLFR